MPRLALHLAVVAVVVLAGVAPVAATGDDATASAGSAAGGATVTTADPSLSTWIAPANATLDSPRAIAVARNDSPPRLTPADEVGPGDEATVAHGDHLVLRVRADGLDDAVAAASGPNRTARFAAAVNDTRDLSLRALQTQATTPPSRQRKEVRVFDPGALTVVPGDRADEYWLVYDTDALTARYGGDGDATAVEPDEAYDWRLATANGTELVRRVTVDRRLAGFDDRDARIDPSMQTVAPVSTTLAPGSTLEVTVSDAADRTVATERVRVGRSGVVRVPVDPTRWGVDAGTKLTVAVAGGDLAEAPAPLALSVESTGDPLRVESATVGRTETRLALAAELPFGGLLVVRRGGPDGEVLAVTEGETVSIPETDVERLAVAAYVDVDGDGSFDPDVDEPYRRNGTVVRETVTPTVAPSLRTWIAPENATLDSSAAVAAAKAAENGTDRLTPADAVALNDTLVVSVRAPGLDARVANATGANLTERFATAVRDSEALSLRANQTPETTSPMRRPLRLRVFDRDALTVVRENATDAYALVYDTGELGAFYRGNRNSTAALDDGTAVRWTLDGEATATAETAFRDRSVAFDRETQVLVPGERPTVRLTTSLAPGTDVPLVVRAENGSVVEDATVTVPADRGGDGWTIERRLAAAGGDGDRLVVLVPGIERADGTASRTTLLVREPTARIDRIDAGIYERATRVVVDFRFNHGGFAVLRGPNDEVLDVFGPFSPTGDRTHSPRLEPPGGLLPGEPVSVTLYRDVDDDDGAFEPGVDEPYRRNGSVVRATATAYDARDDETASSPTAPTTATATDRYTPGRRIPGFGALATLAALSLAGLLALRRQ